MHPQNIRNEIADLLGMSEEERKKLDTMSMTYLIEKLIKQTEQLKKEKMKQR